MRVAGRDTVPVPGARVVLHRIGREVQGPSDSTAADRRGRFRFRFTPDTASVYLVSASYAGIEYFSTPVHTNPALPDTALLLVVADTSSTAPVGLAARHLVVNRPAEDGTRSVLELLVLENVGDRTRVARDTVTGSWAMRLPPGILGFDVGESDFSPEAVTRRNDSLIVFGAIAPGQKQLILTYALPADVASWRIPFDQAAPAVSVMLEERAASVSGGTLAYADSQAISGRTYRRYTGAVGAGDTIEVGLPRPRQAARWALTVLVAVVGVALLMASWRLFRRRPAAIAVEPDPLEAIAALDACYAGREAEVAPEEWARYQTERARLKAELAAALASRGRVP